MGRLQRKLGAFLALIFILMAYYGLLFDYVMGVKDSIIGYLADNGYTRFDVHKLVYENGTWKTVTEQMDVTGFLDAVITLVMAVGPFIAAIVYVVRW